MWCLLQDDYTMKVEFNCLYWPNSDPLQIKAHKRVTDHFELPVNYYEEYTPHGQWMDRVMANSTSDIVVFFDADCVPIDKNKMLECIKHVQRTKTFLGITQVSNHIPPKTHIYAAPAFYVMAKSCWQQLHTSFAESNRGDVAEEVTYRAEELNIRYRCLYPTTFEREPVEGIWPLGNYGYYGVGTTFENTVYHLYQGRMGNNMQLFAERCEEIVKGRFDNTTHFNSKTLDYRGKVVP